MFIENADTGATKKQKNPQTWEDSNVWKTAKKLGVAKELKKVDSDVYKDFKDGVKNAQDVVTFKNLDTDSPTVLKYTEALVKKSLAAPLKDETPWVQAVEDSKVALSSDDVKEYQSPPLSTYFDLRNGGTLIASTSLSDSNLNSEGVVLSGQDFDKDYRLRLALKEENLGNHNGSWNQEDYDSYRLKQTCSEVDTISDINEGYSYDKKDSEINQWLRRSMYLRGAGDLLSSELLKHSLQDDPSNLYFGNDSEVATMIKTDNDFNTKIESIMDEHQGEESFEVPLDEFAFEKDSVFDDLFLSIHGVDQDKSYVIGTRQDDGSYVLQVTIVDMYDFWEVDNPSGLIDNIVNQAVQAQENGIITPFDVLIEFEISID